MDVFLKCKSFTSAEVALSCCSALGVEVVISFSWGAETAEKILLFFFFLPQACIKLTVLKTYIQ